MQKEKRVKKIENADAEIDKGNAKRERWLLRDKGVIKKHNSGVIVRWSAGRRREGDDFESEMRNSIATRRGRKEIRRQPKRDPKKEKTERKRKQVASENVNFAPRNQPGMARLSADK
jgi:hypothetical protein